MTMQHIFEVSPRPRVMKDRQHLTARIVHALDKIRARRRLNKAIADVVAVLDGSRFSSHLVGTDELKELRDAARDFFW